MTLQDSTPTIEILPEHIIDQIKAGEVLERPAALLKELIENSLDAGSTEIHLHLVENGMDLLSIEDNGHGMTFKNLPFAFLRHATSKIKRFEDLYRLHSYGFRGEALASLAASARVTCTTQPKDLNEEGGKIIINGGATELLIPQQSSAHGTSIYIKDLFYNTPARLKFVKSKVSEKSALKKMIYSFVLSHPQVTFTIKWDEKEKEIFKAVPFEQNAERIAQVFFSKRSESAKVIEAAQDYDNYRVRVYFTKDTYTTPQYRHHYLFANKRFFQDKSLHQALLRNLEVFWRFGESGHYVVEIETPTEEIDVNVHPNKTQIKFQRADVVYSLLVASLKAAVKTQAALTPQTLFSENSLASSSEAPSFFTQEENRNFDLMNFSSNEASSMPSDFSLFRAESALIQAPRFQRLLQEFLIVDLAKTYLVDLKKLLATSLSEELFFFQQKEEAAGPLLISEPFRSPKGKIDSHFEELKLLGLEFDRLNAEYIVLRTIPKFLPQVLLSSLAGSLVHYFEGAKIHKFDKNTFSHFYHERIEESLLSSVPDTFIEKYLNNENSNFMVELTSERIRTLFKS